ncbi:MAG: AAA family ATPase [Deltaproteobacteria bacterium]|nr:AAA family ATPase [Deltaproteobacteria bacterium]
MSKIIALTAHKGGSSKSTVAISLATEFQLRGKRVLLVDADPQGSLRAWGEAAAGSGYAAPTIVAMGANLDRPEQLPALTSSYDLTLIDCPPGMTDVHRAALMVADLAIIPCGPSVVDAWALADTFALISKVSFLRPELQVSMLLTRTIQGTRVAASAREALADCRYHVFQAELHYRVAYQEAPALGIGVTRYAPGSRAAKEVRMLGDEVAVLLDQVQTDLRAPQAQAQLRSLVVDEPLMHAAVA